MDSLSLLDMLEEEFLDEKGYIRRKVDVNHCLKLIEQLKNSIPSCIKEAQMIVENKQQILQNADTVAKNTISTAEEQARQLVSGSEVGQIATQEAKKIVYKANIQRDVLIDKTKTHLEGVFNETEQFLLGLLSMVRKNRQELRAVVFN